MKAQVLISACLLLLLAACATSTSNSSNAEYGYLSLAGSMVNREAWVDGYQIGVDPADDSNRVQLKAGSHALEIRSKNRVLLSTEIIVKAGQTLEITVP